MTTPDTPPEPTGQSPTHPVPKPAPPRRPPAAPAVPATASPADTNVSEAEAQARGWGRVDEAGTVFVRTAEGERSVGQMPDATPEEALGFFVRRYVDLLVEVDLLQRRVGAGALSPDEAATSVKQVRAAVHEAQAVGDLAALESRLEALTAEIAQQRELRRQERAQRQEEAKVVKERIVEEAERVSEGHDWRAGANRMRELLDEWKTLPRLDKSTDDALWRRFSGARTTYTRRRKGHFAELNEKRDLAREVKERLVVEAEELATSTEWGPTSGRYRDLMRQWKAAGPAPKGVDERLWRRFRAAQDTFFGARDATSAELDKEQATNAERKEALLAEAEALLPVRDLQSAKSSFRSIAERWDAAGKVPRDRVKALEGRMRRVEQAIRGLENDEWRRTNPEARARAADTVAKLESSLADLRAEQQQALSAGNDRLAAEAAAAIEARESWLDQAQKALDEFS